MQFAIDQFKLGSHNITRLGFDLHVIKFQPFVLVGKSTAYGIKFHHSINALSGSKGPICTGRPVIPVAAHFEIQLDQGTEEWHIGGNLAFEIVSQDGHIVSLGIDIEAAGGITGSAKNIGCHVLGPNISVLILEIPADIGKFKSRKIQVFHI